MFIGESAVSRPRGNVRLHILGFAILQGWTKERASAMLQGTMSAEDARSLETLRGLSDINCEEGKEAIDDLEPWHDLVGRDAGGSV